MCLVIIGWRQHPEFPLILAGNRDEFHARPTQEAHWWPDQPDIFGGRDLQAAGTWLAVHRNGRFATVTNFRDAETPSAKVRSRGHLVSDFLKGEENPLDYLNNIDGPAYGGFNLLLGDGDTLAWLSNRGDGPCALGPGIYGLSNALLDSPWHKVLKSKAALRKLINEDKVNESKLMRLLDDRDKAPTNEVDRGNLSFATAHAISAPFIVLPDYGTRSSSVVLKDATGAWHFRERRFDAGGKAGGDSAVTIAPRVRNRP
jgi:uncharacterized protein with NRDE domain